jgi:cellulose synthase/poly-beta-1,6-N-acetylglucosamine synthase-like glycosyltransferase
MITLASIAFWSCLAVCFYIYFGYPLLLWIVSAIRPRHVHEGDVFPRATLIVPAYNEEKTIGEKISNTLAIDYPPDRIEVLIVSNGSTDRTAEIVRGVGDPRVSLIEVKAPGKIQALNEGARSATGDILVFSDADFLLGHQSLKVMARKFADPTVGGVCGARDSGKAREGDATGEGEGLYGRWDRWQKVRESRIGSVFAADGLLYAIRRELYVPPSDAAQADDIAISAAIPLHGFRLLFEPSAVAWENATVRAQDEFRRKIRVTQHSVRALLNLRSRLFTSGFYSVELLSHKLVRHAVAFFMIALFIANFPLIPVSKFYAIAFAGQVAIYGLAIAGAVLRETRVGRASVFYIPYYFCFVNAAALLGILQMFRGQRVSAWSTRTESS